MSTIRQKMSSRSERFGEEDSSTSIFLDAQGLPCDGTYDSRVSRCDTRSAVVTGTVYQIIETWRTRRRFRPLDAPSSQREADAHPSNQEGPTRQ